MKWIAFMICLVASHCYSQPPQNLVPNGSFESYTQCPFNGFDGSVNDWYNPTGNSPDCLNTCAGSTQFTGYGVPFNFWGYQWPKDGGVAYGNFGLYVDSAFTSGYNNNREYLATPLTEPLQKDTSYCVEFYVSLANNFDYCTTSSIGAYLSIDSVYDYTNTFWDTLNYTPQIVNDSNNYITDTSGWTRVGGSFTSQGGERYLTIGNFYSDVKTKLMHFDSSFTTNCITYYYIDDVWVYKGGCVAHPTSIANVLKSKTLSLYPNPTSGRINLSYTRCDGQPLLEITDIAGRIIDSRVLYQNPVELNYNWLHNGVYTASLFVNGKALSITKFVILK